jgi:hypothetical protein
MAEILQDLKYLGKNSKVILDRQQRNLFGANVSAQAHFHELGALSAQPNLSYSSHLHKLPGIELKMVIEK